MTMTIVFTLVLLVVAATTPFGLRFDGAGMGAMRATAGTKRVLFGAMALIFGIGFVALAAAGAGALLGIDGLDLMMRKWALWLPVLVIATFASLRKIAG